jgi:hypothetical protein
MSFFKALKKFWKEEVGMYTSPLGPESVFMPIGSVEYKTTILRDLVAMKEYAEKYLKNHKESPRESKDDRSARLNVVSHLAGVTYEIQYRE